MALFALVIVGALVAGGYLVAVRQWRATGAGSQGGAALYAADAGLNAGLARLDLGVLDSVRPGDGLTLAKGSLVSGDEYSVRLSRWDAGHDSGPAYYLIASEGRAHGARGGRRQVAAMVRKTPGGDFCCGAGLEARGAVRLDSGAVISGLDIVPDSWAVDAELCGDIELHDRPGIVTDGRVLPAAGALVQGTPPVASPGSTDEFGDSGRWLQELAVSADLRYPGGTVLANVGPAAWANGECGRSSPSNWGAPTAPGHPCFTYFPVIHAAGDLIVGASASGQGILLPPAPGVAASWVGFGSGVSARVRFGSVGAVRSTTAAVPWRGRLRGPKSKRHTPLRNSAGLRYWNRPCPGESATIPPSWLTNWLRGAIMQCPTPRSHYSLAPSLSPSHEVEPAFTLRTWT
jgi:hypothetical protein